MGVFSKAPNWRRELLLLTGLILLLHLPFISQPVQGDEVNYLDVAREVFHQPLTPTNFSFVFQGHRVSMSGHPHPPLNAYLLTLPWLVAGGFSVPVFHLFYVIFALVIGYTAYVLALYFTPHAFWAALLISASPLVQVNANTVAGPEPPLLCFVLIGAAAFFWRRFWVCGVFLTLAAFCALQALAIPPILGLVYVLNRERPSRAAWAALISPYIALGAWQVFQFALTGGLPLAGLTANMTGQAYGGVRLRLESAAAMLQHLGVLVIFAPLAIRRLWGAAPGLVLAFLVHGYAWWERALLVVCVTLGVNALLWLWESRSMQPALAAWALLYFAFAEAVFFAGASRYLLPLVAPMAILFVLQFGNRRRILALAAFAAVFLGLNISFAAYEFSRVYAEAPPPPGKTFLVNGEWGFRYYMLQRGGRMIEASSVPWPGEWIVSSNLALAGDYDSMAEEAASVVRTQDLWVRTPLRLIDRHAHSGFSAASFGLLPFSFSRGPLDRITYSRTSSFVSAAENWKPTEIDGHLVYLISAGTTLRLSFPQPEKEFRLAPFGQGNGTATFTIREPRGDRGEETVLEKQVNINGGLWEQHIIPVTGTELDLTISTPPSGSGAPLKLGWGELTGGPDNGTEHTGFPRFTPEFADLDMGDVRCRPQLISGWYGIEDGAWRWMSKEAQTILRVPSSSRAHLRMKLYFPPDHMTRAGSPITVSVFANGQELDSESYSVPGGHELIRPLPSELLVAPTVVIRLHLDRAVAPSGEDKRELGAVVQEIGLLEDK